MEVKQYDYIVIGGFGADKRRVAKVMRTVNLRSSSVEPSFSTNEAIVFHQR